MSDPLVLATRSPGKLRELRSILSSLGRPVIDLAEAGVLPSSAEDDLESAETFEQNALTKAKHFFDVTRLAVVADDSGLEVFALGGRPGVRSRRWSGRADLTGQALDDANNARLMEELDGVHDRRARYVCVASFVDDERELSARGMTEGRILEAPRGCGGFGYDPYFLSAELGVTFGEASAAAKEKVSHRGRAFRQLLRVLGKAGRG